MKQLNTFKFITEAAGRMTEYRKSIAETETLDRAKKIGNKAFGYIDCMITFLNTMICFENNEFTGDFDEVLDDWTRSIYQAVIDKAVSTDAPSDEICELCRMRDNH